MSADTRTVLIVDDDEHLAELFATWLREDWDVVVAHDGEAGLEALDDAVTVVLLDRRMPGLSGDDTLAAIRERNPAVRVVMVTAVVPDFDIIEMGFDEYVVKPVTRADLLDVVERMAELADYDETVRTLFGLASKRALLETEKSAGTLADSAEYEALLEECERLRSAADAALADVDDADFVGAFRGLATAEAASDGTDRDHNDADAA